MKSLLKANLDKTDFLGIAAEALPAAHQTIFPDQPMRVSADPADPHTII